MQIMMKDLISLDERKHRYFEMRQQVIMLCMEEQLAKAIEANNDASAAFVRRRGTEETASVEETPVE